MGVAAFHCQSQSISDNPTATFSPLAFPNGVILYSYTISKTPETREQLFPFELFRTPFVVIGLADGNHLGISGVGGETTNGELSSLDTGHVEGLENSLRDQFPHALVAQLLVFDSLAKEPISTVMTVPPKNQSRSTTMKTIMCDVSAKVLSEMSMLARTIQSQDSIPSPGAPSSLNPAPMLSRHSSLKENALSGTGAGSSSRFRSPGRSLQRTNSAGADERSGRRMSSPAASALVPSLQRRERSRSPVGQEMSPPRVTSTSTVDLRERPVDAAVSRIRDSSRDRRSLQSPPSISPGERAKNILKLRQGLLMGNLYLMAGRWSDALRDLVDNTTRAKVFGDHIWFAKGLENILATMLLLAWARIDFSVPPICFSSSERTMSLKHIPSANLIRSSHSLDSNDESASRSLSNLSMVLPELTQNIIFNYQRDDGIDNESLPQFPFSETVIRLSFMMTVLRRVGGQLSEKAVKHLVRGSPSLPVSRCSQKNPGIAHLHNTDIAGLVFQAFPPNLFISSMPTVEIITILSGIISVLSVARLYRKRAMIIRETMSILIPRLIQARKVGAAEIGIHPAASLAARHGLTIDSASGAPILGSGGQDVDFHDFLVLLCDTFGVPGMISLQVTDRASGLERKLGSDLGGYAKLEALQRSFGGFELKSEVLRLCSNFSESLPNFHDVVRFTSTILRTAGPGSAPGSEALMKPIKLESEDQLRFATKIKRTLSVFKADDAAKLESEYWDPFLVRDVSLNGSSQAEILVMSGDVQNANIVQSAPAISVTTDERRRRVTAVSSPECFVAEEVVDFTLTLQNLYDFDVIVESVQLVTLTHSVESTFQEQVVHPRTLDKVTVSVVAHEAGEMHITGCRVKIQGCREQTFQLFPKAWKPPEHVKIKTSGLNALRDLGERPTSSKSDNKKTADALDDLAVPVTRKFQVLSPQPKLTSNSDSLAGGSMDLLDGETKQFALSIRNFSQQVTANFLRVSFDYDIDGERRSQRETSRSSGLKQLELLSLRADQSSLSPITPGKSTKLNLSIHGQLGLVGATVYIDYAYLDDLANTSNDAYIRTRRLSIPLQFSIHRSIRVGSVHILRSSTSPPSSSNSAKLLAIDICNAWLTLLSVSLPHDTTISASINPNQSTRLFTDLASLPSVTPTIAYRDPSTDRHGHVSLPTSALSTLHTPRSAPPINITFSALDQSGNTLQFPLQTFITLTVTLTNLSSDAVRPVLSLTPRLSNLPGGEMSKHLAWSGSLRRVVGLIESGGSRDVQMGICVLKKGSYAVDAVLDVVGAHHDKVRGGCRIVAR